MLALDRHAETVEAILASRSITPVVFRTRVERLCLGLACSIAEHQNLPLPKLLSESEISHLCTSLINCLADKALVEVVQKISMIIRTLQRISDRSHQPNDGIGRLQFHLEPLLFEVSRALNALLPTTKREEPYYLNPKVTF